MVKLKNSETVTIARSQIKFAAYNPWKRDPKIVEALRKNLKKVGFLGGIVWNVRSGNLVGGHKRIEAMDIIFGYDGKPENDYEVKVEKVDLDEKTEIEQNIFLNNKRVQGEMDYELLAVVLPKVEIANTGLIPYDLQLVSAMVPDFKLGSNAKVKTDLTELKQDYEERKAKTKALKKEIREQSLERQTPTHFTVTFETYEQKAAFLESYGINGDTIFIKGEEFNQKITAE
jgi:hypothetical protein